MIRIKEVKSYWDLRTFILFPNKLYKNNPYYVPELISDGFHTLSKKKNPAFEFSDGAYFLAYMGNKPVGRVGILVNHRSNEKWGQNRARFTHLDFIDNYDVSSLLLKTAENWAKDRGYDAITGPMGLTDMDHQGMLIEGFEEMDLYFTLYNYPYYSLHLESLGYIKDADWIEYRIDVPDKPVPLLTALADRVKKKTSYRLLEFKNKKDILPWAQEIFDLYNNAYANLYGTSLLSQAQIDMYIKAYFGFINPDFVKIVLDRNDKVIGFGITMPSLSKALRKSRGRLFPFGFIPILKAISKNDTLDLYLVAVHPDHQGNGANALLIDGILKTAMEYGIRIAETGPELEDNKQVQSQWKFFDKRQHRKRRVYIKHLI